MYGEMTSSGDDDYHIQQGAYILEFALVWIMCFHIILQPLGFITHNTATLKPHEASLSPRFSYFKSWRQYEHVHTLFWCGKDWSWVSRYPILWVKNIHVDFTCHTINSFSQVVFTIPTVLIALDFIWCSFRTKKLMVETAHFASTLIWIIGDFYSLFFQNTSEFDA
jgi:hypothetical protein